ncbi:MAG: type II toxin-antitoxin system VapC family toxin [Promethearchaeota archaeon]
MGVFLDTGFYLGLCHPKDKYAAQSEDLLVELAIGNYGVLYTSYFIINEVSTLAAVRSKNDPKVFVHLEKLLWGREKIANILPFNLNFELETWELFKKVNTINLKDKKPMSFTDISSVILCKHHLIEYIVSFDSHFDGFLQRLYQI